MDIVTQTVFIAGVGERLGTGIAHAFADADYQVALLARSTDYVDSLAETLREDGTEVVTLTGDVTDDDAIAAVKQTTNEAFGTVDVAVHNPSARGGELDDPESFKKPLRTRAEGGATVARSFLPEMRDRGSGTLLFTGTTYAFEGSDRLPGWGAAAFATRGLARSLARRASPYGVHVCYVAVGGTVPPAEASFKPEGAMDARTVGEQFRALAEQPSEAWTHEMDLRPSEYPP